MVMEILNDDQTKKINKITTINKLTQILKASGRLLSKVKNFYIRSLTECSTHLDYGMALTCPAGQVPTNLPKSYSVSSTISSHGNDDYRELIRAASTRSSLRSSKKLLGESSDFHGQGPAPAARRKTPNNMPRSHSVGIGRIDEEKSYDFEEDFKIINHSDTAAYAYPRRSKSYAVHRRSTGL